MKLHKLPLYINSDAWIVPMLVPDNYERIIVPPNAFEKPYYAGYLHARHILSSALVYHDLTAAQEALDLCRAWFHTMTRTRQHPCPRNLGVCSAVSRAGARYSNWEMEEAVMTHIALSLHVQQAFATNLNNDASLNQAQLLAHEMEDVARRYPPNKRAVFASEKYYRLLQHILQLARLYKQLIRAGDVAATAANQLSVPGELLGVAGNKDDAQPRKPRSVLATALKQATAAFQLADNCYQQMTLLQPSQPYCVAIADTTFLPVFKFVVDCRTLFNALRHCLAGACYERVLSDADSRKLDLAEEDRVARQMAALVPIAEQLLASPSILLALDRVGTVKLQAELAKQAPGAVASPTSTAGMLPMDLASVNWYLRVLDVTTAASTIVQQQELQIIVDWTRQVLGKLKSNLAGAYSGRSPAEGFDLSDATTSNLPDPRNYLTNVKPAEADANIQALVEDVFK